MSDDPHMLDQFRFDLSQRMDALALTADEGVSWRELFVQVRKEIEPGREFSVPRDLEAAVEAGIKALNGACFCRVPMQGGSDIRAREDFTRALEAALPLLEPEGK